MARIILSMTVLSNLFLLAIVLKTKNKKHVHFILVAHILGIIGWAFFILINIWMPDFTGKWVYFTGDLGYLFEKIIFVSSIIVFSTNYWFIRYFTGRFFKYSFFDYLVLSFQGFVLVSNLIDNLFYTKISIQPQGHAFLEMMPFSALLSIFLLFHLFIPLFIIFREKRKAKNIIFKSQLRMLSLAYSVFLIFSMAINWVLPVYFQIFRFNAFGPTVSLILVGGFVYAITRHQFLDIKLVIQRGAIYTTLLAIVVSFYLFLCYILGILFQKGAHISYLISAGLTAVVGIFGVPPIEKYFRKVTDKIFFKDKYNYFQAVHELNEILNKNIDFESIFNKSSGELKSLLKVKEISFILFEQKIIYGDRKDFLDIDVAHCGEQVNSLKASDKKIFILPEITYLLDKGEIEDNKKRVFSNIKTMMDKFDVSLAVPITLNNEIVGFVCISKKLSGDSFSEEDLNLLETFVCQLTIVMEKSYLYEKVKNHAKELEDEVQKRTAKIKTLQEGQKQMMVDISHGMQTPLTVVKSELGSLRRQMSEDKELRAFEKSIDKISSFIYCLLQLTRMETGDDDFAVENVNFSKLLDELVEYFEVMANEQGISIVSKIEPNLLISGRRDKLEELVTNLVSNSVKYIANDKKIFIRLYKKDDKIKLEIEDTGIGMSEDDLPNVFDRFYRVKGSTKKGTGLGLTICKRIVDKLGGEIFVDSNLGKGTKFTMIFSEV